MQATALTLGLSGLDAHLVHVEVDSSRGPSCFHLVGLAEASVREARVRVRAALRDLGVDIDEHVLTVSLSPADIRKVGSSFDLAMAVGVMAALGKVPPEGLERTVWFGELALSGTVRPVRGVLAALVEAKRLGIARAVVPEGNALEAAVVSGIEVLVARSMENVLAHLRGEKPMPRPAAPSASDCPGDTELLPDLADVRGQPAARRALEIAAAGAHNLLMMGPPGAGKTMLARRLPGILPPLLPDEALEITAIHSVAGALPAGVGLLSSRPFRAPHHTASAAALAGGGVPIRPGEIALAHHGCLFLDELLEFGRHALEALRQPLEDGVVTVCRARDRAVFPARALFVAAVNPCPCGYAGSRRCGCPPERVLAYRARLSGPLLDRIDIQIVLPPTPLDDFTRPSTEESSRDVRARVAEARAIQTDRRARGEVTARTNAGLGPRDLYRVASLDEKGRSLLATSAERLGVSARAHDKLLRLARTIADLEGSTTVSSRHVAEAIQLRLLDHTAPLTLARSA
ncbi:MAG: YifB family Mg chelatase-like AAA ATPase [Polyangiaceae bacterium]|nr:YifB family Mg chelatase-like AAA ATPase [Polyangiaceae bacterium]